MAASTGAETGQPSVGLTIPAVGLDTVIDGDIELE